MESLDPDKLEVVLAQLKAADVSQFRYKDSVCEIFVDFFDDEEDVPAAEGPHVGFSVPDRDDDGDEDRAGLKKKDGYHELFGNNVPTFKAPRG